MFTHRPVKPLPTALVVAALLWTASLPAQAQETDTLVGKTLVVVTQNASLKIEEQSLAQLPLGADLIATKQTGGWLWVNWEGIQGWLNSSNVLEPQQAVQQATNRLAAVPSLSAEHVVRGSAWKALREFDKAYQDYSKAIRLNPRQATAYFGRGLVWEMKGSYDKAVAEHSEALRLNSDLAGAYLERGFSYYQLKQYDKALQDFTTLTRLRPNFDRAFRFRGWSNYRLGDNARALADAEQAIQLESKPGAARFLRREIWAKLGEFAHIVEDYESLLKANPQDWELNEQFARFLATCPNAEFRNGARAVELAEVACRLTEFKSPRALDTLAAAFAERGQFEQAITTEKAALKLVSNADKEMYLDHLQLFIEHKTLHEGQPESSVASVAPDAPATPRPQPSTAPSADGWQEFCSQPGTFCLRFPGKPTTEEKTDKQGDKVYEYTFTDQQSQLGYIASCYDIADEMKMVQNQEALLAIFRGVFANQAKKVIEEKKSPWKDNAGLEMQLELNDGIVMFLRLIITDDHLYSLVVTGRLETLKANEQNNHRFFNSFRLGGPTTASPGASTSGWQYFASDEGRFRIEFPGQPTVERGDDAPSGVPLSVSFMGDDGVAFAASYVDVDEATMQRLPAAADRLKAERDSLVSQQDGTMLLAEKQVSLGSFPGLELRLTKPAKDKTMIMRMFTVHGRQYQIAVVGSNKALSSRTKDVDQYLDSLSLLSVSSPDGKLVLADVAACYSPLGPVREQLVYHPFDTIWFRCQIQGIELDATGNPDLEWIVSLIDSDGEAFFQTDGAAQALPEGTGASVPLNTRIELSDKAPTGDFTLRVLVRDRHAKREAFFTRTVTIRPVEFQIVNLTFTADPEGTTPGPAGGRPKQPFYYQFRAIGFDRSKGRIDVSMKVDVTDEQGRSVLEKPLTVAVQSQDPEKVRSEPFASFNGNLDVEHPGNYLLHLSIHDQAGNQSNALTVPVHIESP